MAQKKPLVMTNGQIEQLQSGDTLDAVVTEVDIVSRVNSNVGSILIGAPVYPDGNGSCDLAQANASGTIEVLGLVQETSISAAASGYIQTDGILAATTGQWDAVTGLTGGLVAGDVYWLDAATAGKLTSTAPTSAGQYVVRVGKGLSTTEMEISVSPPILL